jgi:diaminohydroxyphosphoribosylaminopyrimidine deaminase/5-amino-6-(5-phosphoribosylamino)uracil reductase
MIDNHFMDRALALAVRGIGCVEPNPPVGCVLVRDGRIIAEGYHERFGAPHAEINALRALVRPADEFTSLSKSAGGAHGATAYVTLEPCCHQGKTPPCTDTLIAAGVKRVVAAVEDCFPQVSGQGIAALKAAGIACDVGIRAKEASWLIAPYRKLVTTGRPWVIAKWAMTLDGKLATSSGDSQWISSEASRAVVHQLRARVDAVVVGSRTAEIDNPLLTARPAVPADVKRIATRVVVDSAASLPLKSRLVKTAREIPVLVAASRDAPAQAVEQLVNAGAELFRCAGDTHAARLDSLLDELGRRRMTNVLIEGGSRLLGALFDMRAVDEVHIFIAPKLAGGEAAPSPISGQGIDRMAAALRLADINIEELDGDVYIHGRIGA